MIMTTVGLQNKYELQYSIDQSNILWQPLHQQLSEDTNAF